MNSHAPALSKFAIVLLIGLLSVSGCSSSSSSSPLVDPIDATVENVIIENVNTEEVNTATDTDNNEGVASSGMDESTNNSVTEQENVSPNNAISEPDSSIPAVPDPMFQNRTRVDFEITVPAYQSNALQVRLIWGETDMTAQWSGDELWSLSADLPSDTEQPLAITFYDNNGEIGLGSFEQTYRTGSNESELFRVTAEQFDTDRWDSDGDGRNNLDELIAQTDPLVDEDTLLDVIDSVFISTRMSISANFESRLSEQRPFTESIKDFLPVPEDGPVSGFERNVDINIDSSGNGSFSDFYQPDLNGRFTLTEHIGDRTNTGDSITWDGSWRFKDDALNGTTTRVEFSNTVSIIDDTTRSFVENISSLRSEFFFESKRIETNLVGSIIDTTSLCRPVSGTIEITDSTNNTSTREVETETMLISKEADDTYWKVSEVTNDDETTRTEYFARSLRSFSFQVGASENTGADFICDFVDW